MKLGAVSRHLVRGLVATGDGEECRRCLLRVWCGDFTVKSAACCLNQWLKVWQRGLHWRSERRVRSSAKGLEDTVRFGKRW